MMENNVVLLYVSIFAVCITADDTVTNNKRFPPDFWFGVATASYQVEGAWNENGKGENIWDHVTHNSPDLILDSSTGDIACDSYHKYKEDVALLKDLGVKFYRFSFSWSRILPNGIFDEVNLDGVNYYKNVLRELRANNIEPYVTLYHWDLPQLLQEAGGWPNEFIISPFVEYARLCFTLFGNEVKYWATFNEPLQICFQGYDVGTMAPALTSNGTEAYKCAHNLLKAHAAAYRIYDSVFRPYQSGKISIVIDSNWYEPATNSTEDIEAAERLQWCAFGWFAHPVYLGDYPEVMKTRIANRSKQEGYDKSRLPEFTQEEITNIKGTSDFMSLNTYTAALVKALPEADIGVSSVFNDVGLFYYQPSEWPAGASNWLKITPWGLRKLLNYLKKNYNDPKILITENGFSGTSADDDDNNRIYYIRTYLSSVRDAMEEDGVQVIGYTYWSLLDNFEWFGGYTEKFGLINVDFDSPNRTRTPKNSAAFYEKVCKTHCLVDICE